MKTKSFILVVFFFALILGAGCKKKEVPPPPPPLPPPVIEITMSQFILSLSENVEVKKLESGKTLVLKIPAEVSSAFAEVLVTKFKTDWTYSELSQILKKLPLTVVWVGEENSHLLLKDYFELQDVYKSDDNFIVLDPKPAYSAVIGDKEYWVGPSGKFWKTW